MAKKKEAESKDDRPDWMKRELEAFRRSQLGQWLKGQVEERRAAVLATVISSTLPAGQVGNRRYSASELREEGLNANGRLGELDSLYGLLYEDPAEEAAS